MELDFAHRFSRNVCVRLAGFWSAEPSPASGAGDPDESCPRRSVDSRRRQGSALRGCRDMGRPAHLAAFEEGGGVDVGR